MLGGFFAAVNPIAAPTHHRFVWQVVFATLQPIAYGSADNISRRDSLTAFLLFFGGDGLKFIEHVIGQAQIELSGRGCHRCKNP